ncbi:hypothetical protein [Marinobacter changyiensis]|uniref:hypothetical protein n=1 Tax=Marinobacter changyiensis TaxID=2604091 RepID=UPI0015D27126|nr:hypothetical protein [Marinobacter changyiensis]
MGISLRALKRNKSQLYVGWSFSVVAVSMFLISMTAHGQTETSPKNLGLITKDYILSNYLGSFKTDHTDAFSSTSYSQGRVAYHPERNSVFIDSHVYQLGVGEFRIPQVLSQSTDKSKLPDGEPIQNFVEVIDRTTTGNQDGIDRLGGMAIVNGDLFIQGYDTYDGNGDAKQTTMVVRTPSNLASSEIDGFYEMDGAARTVNYISPIPPAWQELLGGPYLAGNGGGMSISSRLSEGPSLYVFDPENVAGNQWAVNTKEWMNYPFQNALSSSIWQDSTVSGSGDWDIANHTGKNDMWTVKSTAAFAFIVPGTRTFMVIGSSGMHDSGGGYKITNDAGFLCGGFCANDNEDYHSYFWLYDLNEILAASTSHEVIPYSYGIFDDRWMEYNEQGGTGEVTGGSFDLQTGTLVLSHAAATKNHESGSPVISVYKIPVPNNNPPNPPSNITILQD